MSTFDPRSAYLIVGMLYLFMPLAAWIVLDGQRSRAVLLWIGSCALGGVCTLLFGYRGIAPDWVSMTLASSLLIVACLMAIQALRIELGKPLALPQLLIVVSVFLLGFEFARLGLESPLLRVLFASATQAALILYLVWLAVQLARTEGIRSPYWIGGAYLLLVLSFAYRIVAVSGGWGTINLVETAAGGATLDAVLIPLAAVLTAVISQVAYVGIILERSVRDRLAAVAAHARLEENRRTSDRIAHLDRQRSLGELAASLGRELKQPLGHIRLEAGRAIESGKFFKADSVDASRKDKLLGTLDGIIRQIKRASEIIEKIRGYIRPSVFTPVPVDLNKVLQDLMGLVGSEAEAQQVRIMFHLPPGDCWVRGDALLLSQALFHVCRNAIAAVRKERRRELRIHALRSNGQITVSICDTGHGMSEEMQARIDMPFVTTKLENFGGLGLGLSITHSIVALHDGTLNFSPALGGGLCVDISLPALPEAAAGETEAGLAA